VFKKDAIFWIATGIFVLAILIFAITGEQFWLALMIASYLLRPTAASIGLAGKSVDERQMMIQYRSGNIAFAAMMAIAIILAVRQNAEGDPNWDLFNIVIIGGLAVKALFNVVLAKNFREGASKIITSVGLMIALFASMSHAFSLTTLWEAAPGLAIALLGLLSRRFPRAIGILVFVATAAMLVRILSIGFTIGQITAAAIIGVPMILAGLGLFVKDRDVDAVDLSTAP